MVWIVRVESKLPVFCAHQERSAFVRVHDQRKQSGLDLQPDDDLQQARMK